MKNLLAALFLICGLAARAQTFTPIHNYQQPDGLSVFKYFGVPYGPTPILNVTRTVPGAVFYNTTDSSLYSWTGVQWLRATGGVVISPSPGVDSITISGNVICQWRAGVSTCYALDRFFTDVALSADRLRYIYYNFMGDSLKTVDIPHTIAEQGAGMILTRRGDTVNFASSGTGGTVPKFTPTAVPFATGDSTLGEDQPGLNYNGTNLAVGHNNPNAPSGMTINGSRGLILADIGGLYISAGGNGTIGTPDATKHVKLQNNSNTLVDIYADGNTMVGLHANIKTDVLIDSLKTTGTAPVSAGTDRMVTTDINGKLSFAVIPTPGGSVSLTAGLGLAASPSTITGSGSFALDSASAVVLSRARAAATYQPLITGTGFVKSTAGTITYDNSTYQTSNQAVTVTATGDATGTSSASGTAPSIPLVLATVNSNVGSFTNASVTVNAKGLVTAVSSGAAGGTPDSSWITGEFGTTPNTIGTLVNQNFSGGSIPSGWSVTGSSPQLVTSYSGSKLTVTGGNSWGQPAAGNITGAYASGLQYDTRRMPYEKIDFSMSVVPTTKAAGNVIAVAKGQMGLTYLSNETIAWNLSSDINGGRVGLGTDTVVTWATGSDSTAKAVFNIGDSLILYYHKDGWAVTAGIYNKTTGIKTISYFNQIWNGAGGKFNLVFLKGTWAVTNVTISSFCRKGVPYFVSTSQWSGSGNTSMQRRTPNLIMNNDVERFEVMGLPSMETKYFNQGGIVTELINDAQPSAVVWNSGFNDETAAEGAGATNIATDSIFAPLQRASIPVYVTSIQPKVGITAHVYNDSLIALAARRSFTYIETRTPLLNAALAMDANNTWDLLHINDAGSAKEALVIQAKIGNLLYPSTQKDTFPSLKIRGIPVAQTQQVVSLMGVDSKGNAVLVANFLPTVNKWVLNTSNNQSYSSTSFSSTPSQPGGIHMQADITTDSAYNSKNTRGWFGGLNADGLSTMRNVIFDAGGPSGLPGQRFAELTGTNNFLYHAGTSSITGWTGSNNFIQINNNPNNYTGSGTVAFTTNFASTSGSNNFFAGIGGGKGITTGSGNFDWEPSATGPATNVSNTITFGSSATAFNNDIKQTGDVSFGTGANVPNFWFGGRAPAYSVINMNAGGANGTNFDGGTWNFNVSRSTGLKLPGNMIFNTYAPVATGSTLQSTLIPKFRMSYSGFSYGSTAVTANAADLLVDMQTTTQGFGPPRMTTAQRDAMVAGVQSVTGGGGTGYTNGVIALAFTGGTGTAATAYATISGGVVSTPVLVTRGNYTVSPTGATITSGAGTGATFTVNTGVTVGSMIFCTDCTATDGSTGVNQTWVASSVWKNNW